MPEEWISMSAAADRLGVPLSQISRLAARGTIRVEQDAINRRVRLVEFGEVKEIFSKSKYYNANK
jgi:hypothetical protein